MWASGLFTRSICRGTGPYRVSVYLLCSRPLSPACVTVCPVTLTLQLSFSPSDHLIAVCSPWSLVTPPVAGPFPLEPCRPPLSRCVLLLPRSLSPKCRSGSSWKSLSLRPSACPSLQRISPRCSLSFTYGRHNLWGEGKGYKVLV